MIKYIYINMCEAGVHSAGRLKFEHVGGFNIMSWLICDFVFIIQANISRQKTKLCENHACTTSHSSSVVQNQQYFEILK